MLRVKKGNVIYDISESQLNAFLDEGYDQIDPKTGKVIKQATGGRTYSVREYRAILDENERLKAELTALKKSKADK